MARKQNARENEKKKGKGDQTLLKAVESDRQRRQTDENDAISESSNDTSASLARCEYAEDEINDDKELGNDEKLNQCLDNMTEERSATRVQGLQNMIDLLNLCLTSDCIESRRDSILSIIFSILRRPSKQEGELAPRLLSIIALTLGANEMAFFDEARSVLQVLVKNEGNETTRVACLEALAICCLICCDDEQKTHELIDFCETFMSSNTPNDLCRAAIDSWTILVSLLPHTDVAGEVCLRSLNTLLKSLDHEDVGVRSAAGEAVALLFESAHLSNVVIIDKQAVADKLFALSKESDKKSSKKDRKDQRSVFRDVYKTVEHGESPALKLTVRNEPLSFSGWGQLKQVAAIKSCLQSGFQEHVQFNGALRSFLGLTEAAERQEKLNGADKRKAFSKTSSVNKKKTTSRRDERRTKNARESQFLMDY